MNGLMNGPNKHRGPCLFGLHLQNVTRRDTYRPQRDHREKQHNYKETQNNYKETQHNYKYTKQLERETMAPINRHKTTTKTQNDYKETQ